MGEDERPPVDQYRCECMEGFANGICAPGWNANDDMAAEYAVSCSQETGGHCEVDMDECLSDPCQNGAACTDSTTDGTIPAHSYSCGCVSGFAGGSCAYSPILSDYEAGCEISDTSGLQSEIGNCDIDVDECVSSPCQNGALCSESNGSAWERLTQGNVSISWVELVELEMNPAAFDEFQCTCAPGYANGVCGYSNLAEFDAQCNITSGGICNVDVDECESNPCQNGAVCLDSTNDASVAVDTYRCVCDAGYANGECDCESLPNS
jgi:hypothetical protein